MTGSVSQDDIFMHRMLETRYVYSFCNIISYSLEMQCLREVIHDLFVTFKKCNKWQIFCFQRKTFSLLADSDWQRFTFWPLNVVTAFVYKPYWMRDILNTGMHYSDINLVVRVLFRFVLFCFLFFVFCFCFCFVFIFFSRERNISNTVNKMVYRLIHNIIKAYL